MPEEEAGGHRGGGEAGRGPDAERPAGAEMIGVPPSAMPMRSAITRPRMDGAVESCIRLLVALVRVKVATPITTSAPAKSR